MSSGIIIAGGLSTRFGEADKAITELAGTPMIRRVADRIAPAIDSLVVNCRAEQVDPIRDALVEYEHEVSFAVDTEPDRGPMAGVMTGLQECRSEYAFVVACDMPFVDPGMAAYLFDRAETHDAALPRLGEWYQTTQAVYRAETMVEACEAALENGEGRIVAALSDLDVVVIDEPELRAHADLTTFENVNTRAELEAAEARLRAGAAVDE